MNKQHGVLFMPEMVSALLAGRKTITRRLQGLDIINKNADNWAVVSYPECSPLGKYQFEDRLTSNVFIKNSPINVGDLIYVKETHWAFGYWVEQRGKVNKKGESKMQFIVYPVRFEPPGFYFKSYHEAEEAAKKADHTLVTEWYQRNSLFMRKADARLWYRITKVKVERLDDITEMDAINEGIEFVRFHGQEPYFKDYSGKQAEELTACNSFATLWESIHGKESLESNPWVFAYEFEAVKKPNIL